MNGYVTPDGWGPLSSMNSSKSEGLRVLHIEDCVSDAALIHHSLNEAWPNSKIHRVASEEEVRVALDEKQEWDVILSDYSMPGFNGLSALEITRSRGSTVPFIFLSGTIGEVKAVDALKRGATDYVLKDHMGRLIPAIRRALNDTQRETSRRSLESQLRQAQRLESIGLLAGGIAHDLNNMLTPIFMGMEMLRRKVPDEHSQQLIDLMTKSAEHGAGLIRQVLSFSKGTESSRQILAIGPVIADVASLLRETLPRTIAMNVSIQDDLPGVRSDATQLSQVLMNLCVNARDAMPDGGRIDIKVVACLLTAADLRGKAAVLPGDFVKIIVHDTGTGISPEVLSRIFDPFFTTKAQRGTGLGLSTVVSILKEHGGFIDVETEVGKGTTFHVFLPSATTAIITLRERSASPFAQGRGETILVADDEQTLREMMRSILEQSGYHVLLASTGQQAIELFSQYSWLVAVVIADCTMPQLSASAMVTGLRALNPQIKIILMSGLEGAESEAARFGANRFLAKPMSGKVLVRAVAYTLENNQVETPPH
ncbi:response regulator [Oleiharenicola lentus]|uniref:hybrid sensor histidine kinase/response regulator n=1 Tax=Oleiharenicola lentus TaxID=2508720 RepID=UPI003F67C1AE